MIVCNCCCYSIPVPVFNPPPGFLAAMDIARYAVIGAVLVVIGINVGFMLYHEWWLKRTSMHMQGGSA